MLDESSECLRQTVISGSVIDYLAMFNSCLLLSSLEISHDEYHRGLKEVDRKIGI